MKKLITSIILMVLINALVVLYFMFYGAEKYDMFGFGTYTVTTIDDRTNNNFLSLFPLVDFIILFLYFIFSHSIPFYLNNEESKKLKKFQIFRLIISLITLVLLIYYTINLFTNGEQLIYQLTFILILFFEIIYILIGCKIIEKSDYGKYGIFDSALNLLLMYFSIGLFFTYAFYRVNNLDLLVFRFILSAISLFIYAVLSGYSFIRIFGDDKDIGVGILSIVVNLISLLSLYFIYQYFYSYKFFLIVSMIINIILLILVIGGCISFIDFPRGSDCSSTSASTSTTSSYSTSSTTSSYSTSSTITDRPSNLVKTQTVVNKPEEIFVCKNRDIDAKPYNPHVDWMGLNVCDWEVTLTCVFESNYGNQVTIKKEHRLTSKSENEVIPLIDAYYRYVINGSFTKDRVHYPW